MFSSSAAAEAIAMRPGLVSGGYPERTDREPSTADSIWASLKERLGRFGGYGASRLHKVAASVGQQGEALAGLNRAELDARVIGLRRGFRNHGLNTPLCIEALALIREMSDRTLKLRHYDTQVMAGWAMIQGYLAEMETGEGKTLAATLAAATVALAGIPVHVITVNEYLVERDAKAMAPLYKALGLTVAYVTQSMEPEERRAAYACDITYCTNKQVTFDYLRDRLLLGDNCGPLRLALESAYAETNRMDQMLLRGLCFAIVDEADSVLIDEARTPLILTRSIDSTAEHAAYQQALQLAGKLENGNDFFLDAKGRGVQLSLAGQQKLAALKPGSDGVWQNARRREELVGQALHAIHVLQKDRDYLVDDDKVLIVDANTGRTMPDRSWERGLHQLVEAKENCPLTENRESLGRLTYQRFFRRYLRLSGMTGTAREVAPELGSVYGLQVQPIPLNRPGRRRELPARVFVQANEKWAAVIDAIKEMQSKSRPVLIGTGSVADSELLSRKLTKAGMDHRVLNARQDKAEAEIVAAAGRKGQITVATNMAGRGTDIPLAQGVDALGGLHVIAACRNDARRIDRQLFGRCARQGDPGSFQVILSLEDELVDRHCHPMLIKMLVRCTNKKGRLQQRLNLFFFRRAQQKLENQHREARRTLLQHDQQTGRLLAFSGNME